MPDAQPTSGTPVWRHSWPGEPSMPVLFGNRPTAKAPSCEPGTWYPEALDAARSRVIEAARKVKLGGSIVLLTGALRALDALTQEAPDA